MTARPRPHIHARDHEHGGADTIRIHYEDVGSSGGGSGGGIMFDTYPQTGGFLEVETSSYINLHSDSSNIQIRALGSGAGMTLAADASLTLDGGSGFVYLSGSGLALGASSSGTIKLTLASTKWLTVYKSDGTTKLLEVRDDATFHIKTGAAWVADL